MKILRDILLVFVIGFVGVPATTANEVKRDVEILLTSRGGTNAYADVLAHKSAVVDEIKTIVSSGNEALRLKALTTLANMGDSNAVHNLVRDYDKASPTQKVRFQRELERFCRQPSLILYLIPDLDRDEDSTLQFVDNEFFVEPRSVVAARIIRSVLLKSEQIPENTKMWASRIDVADAQTLRTAIRHWCNHNKAHLVTLEYRKAVPFFPESVP